MFSVRLSKAKENGTGFYIDNYSCLRLAKWHGEDAISPSEEKLTYYCKPFPQLMRIITITCIRFGSELSNKEAAGLNVFKQK